MSNAASVVIWPSYNQYGPHATIACPGGAVSIAPGANIQTAIDANPPGTTFCLGAGMHSITASLTPKSGDTFVGQYGATLDGTGWSSTESTQAAFRAHNENIDNVTIRNLVIRNMPVKGVHAFRDFSSGWIVEYCEISGCKDGVSLSSGATIQHNYIHHNIGDPGNIDAGLRGGGYSFNEGTGLLVYHNEISYNGPEQKSIDIGSIVWRGNFVHHNYLGGIWVDGDGNGSTIEDNVVEDQAIGIWYELARGAIIRNNMIRRHTEQGIFLSTSKNNDVYGNTLDNNRHGIQCFVDLARVGLYAWSGDLADNSIHNNIVSTSGSGAYGGVFSYTGTGVSLTPYMDNTKNNNFDFNTYYIDDMGDLDWLWNTARDWSGWQGLPQDVNSTRILL